jgi:deoxyribose-phosphate aldolase
MSQLSPLLPSTEALRRDWRVAAQLIDHTLLKPEATRPQIVTLCREALAYRFCSVVVNPSHVALCKSEVNGSGVLVCAVIGFPLGATTTTAKLAEATDAIRLGARELDMVLNIGALKDGERQLVMSEIRSLARLCHSSGARLKVILETALLSTGEKILACNLAREAEADFVKTSTGFSTSGATVADVGLLRGVVGNEMGVKASGGIRDAATFLAMVEAGASRIGSSSSVAIVGELGAE